MSLKHKARYSTAEQNDMIRCYQESGRRNRRARKLYAELYPKRRLPKPELFLEMTKRAREDDQDVGQNIIIIDPDTDDDDKEKVRLAMSLVETHAIVYTTRLEQMSIFRGDISKIEPKRLVIEIFNESKPKFDEYKTNNNCNEHYAMYDEMVQKLDDVFSKKVIGTGNTIVIDEDEDSALSSYDDNFLNRRKLYYLNQTSNAMSAARFKKVEPIVPTPLFDNIGESIMVEKYRSVFLSFSCTNTNATDLYYIDNKGLVTLHNRINDNFDASEYVGLTETCMFFYCCWYKRRELTLALNELPKETLQFMSERHICIISSCTCCCSPQKMNALKSRNFTETQTNEDVTVIDDTETEPIKVEPIASKSIDQEFEYAISQMQRDIFLMQNKQKRTVTNERNDKSVVANKNKWLQKVISAVLTSTACITTSKNSFVTAMMMTLPTQNMKKPLKLLKPNVTCRPNAHVVIHLTSMERNEIFEINGDKLISRVFSENKDRLSKSSNSLHTFKLADDISVASRESSDENIVSTVTVPCCWYFREVLINARHGAYDFMRQPHACAVGHCNCCCKSLRLAEANKKVHWYVKNKVFNRLLGDFEPINDLVQFRYIREASRKTKPRLKVTVPSAIPSHSNLSQKQVPNNITNTNKEVTAPVTHLGSKISLPNNQIQTIVIDDDDPSSPNPLVPADSQTYPDSDTFVIHSHFQKPEEDKPSSKITLFTPEMACTITTYALDSSETFDEFDGFDPLGGTSAVVKDYSIDSSLEAKGEIEDDDETESNDVESDPLIYTNVETDTDNDPLAADDTLIEIKDEDEPRGIDVQVPHVSVNVEHLISSILERFPKVKLFINQEGNVTADIGVCVTTLTSGELTVLAKILSKAQEQVNNLGLNPGTVLRGEIPITDYGNKNVHKLPNFMFPETNEEMFLPRIENVFSLNDSQDKHQEASKLRVRPMQELGVTKTNTMGTMETNMAQANETLETAKPTSWLLRALTSDMKPMTNTYPVNPPPQASSSVLYDSQKVQKFVILKDRSQSTPTPPEKIIENPKDISECRSGCICNQVTKKKKRNHPFAKKFDNLKCKFRSRSQFSRTKPPADPTHTNPRQKMPLTAPATATSAIFDNLNPSSNISAVVISIDSDDDD